MSKVFHVVAALALLAAAAPGRAAVPVIVAANRCNSQTIDVASGRLRDFDRHGPGRSSDQQLQRYGALVDIVSVLNEERDVLDSLCGSDSERAPMFAEIASLSAWALALESDIAGKLNASCAAAATGLPTMMLADAWLTLANIINGASGAVPPSFNDVIPKVRSRAAAVGLTLPAWPDTSAYWRDQVRAKAKAAIDTCPSPSPSAGPPSPSASP